MSSITMAADSTQSDHLHKAKKKQNKKKKHRSHSTSSSSSSDSPIKKKSKKSSAKEQQRNSSDSNCESDLDLSRLLLPISGYMEDKEVMIENMFKSISSIKLKAMLPEILQSVSMKELKKLCLEQLFVMSSKRINQILDGVDSKMISSSSGEDNDNEDENINSQHLDHRREEKGTTSVESNHTEVCENPKDSYNQEINIVKHSRENKLESSQEELSNPQKYIPSEQLLDDKQSRLARKDSITVNKKLSEQDLKQEVSNIREATLKNANSDDVDGKKDRGMSKSQLEILELEMRARAIKAMLKAQEEKERKMERKSCERDLKSHGSHADNKKQLRLSQSDHTNVGHETVRESRDMDHRSKNSLVDRSSHSYLQTKAYGKRH